MSRTFQTLCGIRNQLHLPNQTDRLVIQLQISRRSDNLLLSLNSPWVTKRTHISPFLLPRSLSVKTVSFCQGWGSGGELWHFPRLPRHSATWRRGRGGSILFYPSVSLLRLLDQRETSQGNCLLKHLPLSPGEFKTPTLKKCKLSRLRK